MAQVKYKAKADCLVFGHFRAADEEFTAPAWKEAYKWPMPDFLEVLEVFEEPAAEPKTQKAAKGTKDAKTTEAQPAQADLG